MDALRSIHRLCGLCTHPDACRAVQITPSWGVTCCEVLLGPYLGGLRLLKRVNTYSVWLDSVLAKLGRCACALSAPGPVCCHSQHPFLPLCGCVCRVGVKILISPRAKKRLSSALLKIRANLYGAIGQPCLVCRADTLSRDRNYV